MFPHFSSQPPCWVALYQLQERKLGPKKGQGRTWQSLMTELDNGMSL